MTAPIRLIVLPDSYRVVEGGRVAERGVLTPGAAAPNGDFRTVLVVPGAEVLCRWLDLPQARDAQAAGAAFFLLEEGLAAPREDLHIAVGAREADGTRLVAVAARARMQAWLDAAAAFGVRPDAVVPDCLMLPEPDGDEAVAVVAGDAVAVRGRRLALSCEPDLLPLVMGDRPWRLAEGPEAERLSGALADAPPINLLQGAFGRRPAAGQPRAVRALVLAGLLFAAVLALPVVQAVRHHLAARAADARILALAGPGAGEPAARLQARVARLRAAEAFPTAAAAVFAAIEGIEGMELQSLLYGEDGALRAGVTHVNYSDVEVLKTVLARAGLQVQETSAGGEQGQVMSDLVIRSRP